MSDRYTPVANPYRHSGQPSVHVVVAIDTQTGEPTCLYAGQDKDLARTIRNRAGKGRGGFSHLSHVRMSEVEMGAHPQGVDLSNSRNTDTDAW